MVCPACASVNRDGARFCGECGTALAARCPACGAEHAAEQRFCTECGTPLAGAGAAARPIATDGPGAGAELRLVSVLFVDLVGYTSLSETRDAEEVRELLGRYFETARTIVDRYGGVVEKFIGDAVMAVWGTPVAQEDDAERAVRAGLDVVAGVTAFGEEVGAPELRARAGVVTGQAASLANPGQGLVVGDRVNTASRAQSTAQPGTVYVDDVTRRASSAAIAYSDTGEHSVKGKAEPLRLWRAVRVVAGTAGSQREEGLEAPFVGRDADLRLVKELFHQGIDREAARLVAVSGPAGVGKSRLRWEFEKYSDGLALSVLWHSGRCLSYGDGVAYWALAEMVRQRLGIAEEASAEEAAVKLAGGLERWVPEAADRDFIAPRLGALLGIAEPKLGREDLFAGWRLFFERLAQQDPVVLVFEDLQWADTGLLDFLDHLLDWSAQHRIVILTFARPELGERRDGWPAGRRGATVLYLEPLDAAATGELLDGLVTLPAEARARIVSRAEGIPLYAIETVRALADRGILGEHDGGLVLVRELGDLDVPASLTSLLAARLDALAPEERELAKSMSVFSGSFPGSAAAALGGVAADHVDSVLAALVRKQILAIGADPLSPDRGHYTFAQTLLRTVAYEMLGRRERKQRHLAAAAHLRAAFPDDGEDVAEVIAAHYLDAYHAAAGDPDVDELRGQALAAQRRGAARARTIGAPEVAARAYLTARELAADEAERTELVEAAAEMTDLSGLHRAALELFDQAAAAHAQAGRPRDAARVSGRTGTVLGRLGRNAEGIERMRAALEVLGEEREDADMAALSVELGFLLVVAARSQEAVEFIERGLAIGQDLQLSREFADGLIVKGIMCSLHGRADEARIYFDAAIEFARERGLDRLVARAQLNSGDLLTRFDLPGSAERCQEALASFRRLGDRAFEATAVGNLMVVELMQGRWSEALRGADEILSKRPEADIELVHRALAIVRVLRGDVAAATEHLAAMSEWAGSDHVEDRQAYEAMAAHVAFAAGRDEDALAALARALPEAMGSEGPSSDCVRFGLPVAIDAAMALQRPSDAAALIELVAAHPPGRVPPFVRAQLDRGRGLVAAARGDREAARVELAAAVDGLRALAYPFWLASAQTDLAAHLIEQDRGADAVALLAQAEAVLTELDAGPALERARGLDALMEPRPG